MRVTIFGTGAMGCLFAARLSKAARVTMLGTWREAIQTIRRAGIRIEESGQSRSVPVAAEFYGTPLPPADLVLVLVKSWQTQSVAGYLPQYLGVNGAALSLQNGLGNIEALGEKAFPGVTEEGATLSAPGYVIHCGAGPTHVTAPEHVAELFRNAGFETYACAPEKAESLIWGKLAVNCGINALTALLGVCNGELLKREGASVMMRRAALECASVADAGGIVLPFADAAARVTEVARKTAKNRSSMFQDILRGCPTEIDAINGAVVREGTRLQVPTPVNEALWQAIKQRESNLI